MEYGFADRFYQATVDAAAQRHSVERVFEMYSPERRGTDGLRVALAKWRSDLRRDFTACLGGLPVPCPLNIRRGERVTRDFPADLGAGASGAGDAYTRERVIFEAEPGLDVPAYVLTPEGADASAPTAIALAGHGFGVADIVGLRADGSEQNPDDRGYHKAFAVSLARRGFVVIAPELFGFGSLRLERDIAPDKPGASSCDAISAMLLMVGRTTAGVRVNQAIRCIDALRELGYGEPPVAMGISGGGLVCAYFAALDERVRACCVSGFSNTYRGSILAVRHCVDNFQPGLLLTAEMPDVLSLIAPRPMIWEAGEDDHIFPIKHVLEAQDTVKRAYEAYGAAGDFELDRFSGGHQIHGAAAYDFLWNHRHAQ